MWLRVHVPITCTNPGPNLLACGWILNSRNDSQLMINKVIIQAHNQDQACSWGIMLIMVRCKIYIISWHCSGRKYINQVIDNGTLTVVTHTHTQYTQYKVVIRQLHLCSPPNKCIVLASNTGFGLWTWTEKLYIKLILRTVCKHLEVYLKIRIEFVEWKYTGGIAK